MEILPPVSWTQSIKLAFRNYINFYGRARRSEFFYFYATIFAITFFLFMLYIIAGDIDFYYDEDDDVYHYEVNDDYEIIIWIIAIIRFIVFLPLLGLMVRRLHDIGRTGCLVLLDFIPLIGQLILICILCIDSEKIQNQYGPSPKYVMSSGSLFPENNYVPPHNIYSQSNPVVIPVNNNQNQNPISSEGIPNFQPDPYLYNETPNIPQNPITRESLDAPQPYNFVPQETPYSNTNPIQQQPSEDNAFSPNNDLYSKPNPNQPSSDNYYNSSAL